MSYVVTGATGQVGSAVVDYLLAKSVSVHVIIRSEDKAQAFRSRNIQVTIGDLTDIEVLTKVFQDAKAVFAMNPPGYEKPDLLLAAANVSQALATAIQAAKVERVVVLSSVGAELSAKTGCILTTHTLEEALKKSAPQVVIVRCAWFTENWLSAASAVKAGHTPVLGSMLQKLDRKIPHVATNDIGRVVSEYMLKPNSEVDKLTVIQLEGPEPYSPNDIAKAVGDVLGNSVAAVPLTDDHIREILSKHAWPKTTADNWIEMVRSFDDNTIHWTTDEKTTRIQGKVTIADVLKTSLK